MSKDPSERIKAILEPLTEEVSGSRVKVHRYADGSIDGEILIKLPRGVSTADAADQIQQGIASMPRGFWISAGQRFTIKANDEVYRKRTGLNEVSTSYQRSNRANLAEILLILREKIGKGTARKYRRKAEQVFLRVRYSPTGKRPKA